MPLRSLNVYLSPSLLIVHDSARPGTICVLSSGKVTSVSTIRRPTRLELRSVTCAGSRFTGSATRPTTSVPAGWAATGPPRPRSTATIASHAASIFIDAPPESGHGIRSAPRVQDTGVESPEEAEHEIRGRRGLGAAAEGVRA